jgi:uncharacterized protein YjbI with pentapeptide repeats
MARDVDSEKEHWLLKAYREGRRDFSGVCLSPYGRETYAFDGADLRDLNLTHAEIKKTSFSGCSLDGASFEGCSLHSVYFDRLQESHAVILDKVHSENTTFAGSHLSGYFKDGFWRRCSFANVRTSSMDFSRSHLVECDFSEMDIGRVTLGHTAFIGCDLTAMLLASVTHSQPSSVDFRSILLSRHAKGLSAFLVRTGMAEVAATYIVESARAVTDNVFRQLMHSTFISYGNPDYVFAKRLSDDLARNGSTTFFFPEDAEFGQPLHRVMSQGVNEYDRVILICSEQSLERSGVLNEIEQALAREARMGGISLLIPIALDRYLFDHWNPKRADLKRALLARVVADFSDSAAYAPQFQRLLSALRKS